MEAGAKICHQSWIGNVLLTLASSDCITCANCLLFVLWLQKLVLCMFYFLIKYFMYTTVFHWPMSMSPIQFYTILAIVISVYRLTIYTWRYIFNITRSSGENCFSKRGRKINWYPSHRDILRFIPILEIGWLKDWYFPISLQIKVLTYSGHDLTASEVRRWRSNYTS